MDLATSTDAIGTGDRQICAILAAQVAALRERVASGVDVELLWRTMDVLSVISELLCAWGPAQTAQDVGTSKAIAAAIAAADEVTLTLEAVALQQSQTHDLASQMAECVQNALQRLAMPMGNEPRMSAADLVSTYVCDEQRLIHATVGLGIRL